MNEAALMQSNEGLVRFAYRRLVARWPSLFFLKEDLFQEGRVGMLHAVRHYDGRAGARFATYAYPCVRGAMLDLLKRGWRSVRCMRSLRGPLERDAADAPCGPDVTLAAALRHDDRLAALRLLAALRKRLDPRSDLAVELRFGGCTMAEVGDCLGVTKERARQIIQRAIRTMYDAAWLCCEQAAKEVLGEGP